MKLMMILFVQIFQEAWIHNFYYNAHIKILKKLFWEQFVMKLNAKQEKVGQILVKILIQLKLNQMLYF